MFYALSLLDFLLNDCDLWQNEVLSLLLPWRDLWPLWPLWIHWSSVKWVLVVWLSLHGHTRHIDLVIVGVLVCEPLIIVGYDQVTCIFLRFLFICIKFSDFLLRFFGFSFRNLQFKLSRSDRGLLGAICGFWSLGVLRDEWLELLTHWSDSRVIRCRFVTQLWLIASLPLQPAAHDWAILFTIN